MHPHQHSGAYERSDGNIWFWNAGKQRWAHVGSIAAWEKNPLSKDFTVALKQK